MMYHKKWSYLKNTSFLFIALILIVGIGIYIYSFPVKGFIFFITLIIYWFYTILFIVASILWVMIFFRRWKKVKAKGENVLIVAPHQDDGVAMAGGFAIQTIAKGGKVFVVYLTEEKGKRGLIRKKEAIQAWNCIGLSYKFIRFMGYRALSGLILKTEVIECIKKMITLITAIKPNIIFIPAYEGGHYQHDIANYIISRAMKKISIKKIRIFEVPLYNFYYSLRKTPEKILAGIRWFIPFGSGSFPPEPIRDDPVYLLDMENDEVEMKCIMLNQFISQNPNALISRFGYPDRFQRYRDYDYSKPPFDYDRSLAKKINFIKELPVIGEFVSKKIKWTKTIHPKYNYTITRIPF